MPFPTPPVLYDLIRLGGGMDQVTPTLSLPPGVVRRAANFECNITGGYTRIAGYERFDGRPNPSDARYIILSGTTISAIAVGDTVTGNTSHATGKVIAIPTGQLVLTRQTGTFVPGEYLTVGATIVMTSIDIVGIAADGLLDAQYKSLAAADYRAVIAAVPGSGQIRGVAYYAGDVYAWRNNAGGTALAMYKSSSSGWTAISFGRELTFTSGGLEYATGSITLTGGAAGSIDTLTVNGVSIISAAVTYTTGLNETAAALAANINAHTSTPEYTATASGATVTIRASTGGTGPNGFVVAATATTLTFTTTNMAGGVNGTEIVAGNVITGATSGATATITAVALESGTWAAGTAAGRLIFASQTGTFVAENLNIGATTNRATIAGNSSAITMLPNGRVQGVVGNFGGGQTNRKLYFCDGVNPAFEWDGTALVPIRTTMSPDVPTRIQVHQQHLFLAFGHSLQFSAIGNPYSWDPVLGAGEIAMNDDITQLVVLPGNQSSAAMGVYTRSDTAVLYGTSAIDFQLTTFNIGTGCLSHTAQTLDQVYALSDRGVMAMATTLNFGNFLTASLTMNLRPFVQARRDLATASAVNREKGQYRVFFSDSYGLYLTLFNGKFIGAVPVQFPNPVLCCTEGLPSDGDDNTFFGSDNGFVYRLDAGTSFDGQEIAADITLVYNSTRLPRLLKRYRKASVELTGDSYAEFNFGYDLGYRTPYLEQPADAAQTNDLRSAFWDSFEWDNFVFDGRDISPSEIEVTGTAENMAIRISSVSNLLEPFTVNSIIVHYTIRRGLR